MSRPRYADNHLDQEIRRAERDIIEATTRLADLINLRDAERGSPRPSDNLTPDEIALIDSDGD